MSLVRVEFDELYARRLGRHSRFGSNVRPLAALFGVWFGVYGTLYWLIPTEWLLIAMAGSYPAMLLPSVALRAALATGFYLVGVVCAVLWLPGLPIWAYLVMIPVFYKLQAWSHKWYTVENDMTVFNQKYTKGFVLFVVLLFFEVPILLNYLLFGRKDWAL